MHTLQSQTAVVSETEVLSRLLGTMRSVREFRPKDVSPSHIEFILHHAVQAGSAKNRQPWRFVVIRNRNTVADLASWYRQGWAAMSHCVEHYPDSFVQSAEHKKQMRSGTRLVGLFETSPVVIVTCFVPSKRHPANFYGGASVFPAIQNLLLAARALGLGATLTMVHSIDTLDCGEQHHLTNELRAITGIPDNITPAAVIPIGWPAVPFSRVRREPFQAVTYSERWGDPW